MSALGVRCLAIVFVLTYCIFCLFMTCATLHSRPVDTHYHRAYDLWRPVDPYTTMDYITSGSFPRCSRAPGILDSRHFWIIFSVDHVRVLLNLDIYYNDHPPAACQRTPLAHTCPISSFIHHSDGPITHKKAPKVSCVFNFLIFFITPSAI